MITTILTPQQVKTARNNLGLSQNRVAKDTGISRTTLALFEVNKYLLTDEQLISLQAYFENSGHVFNDSETLPPELTESTETITEPTGIRLLDGFAIPENLDSESIETTLSQLHDNEAVIEQLFDKKAGMHWFTEEPKKEGLEHLLTLMAESYLLIQKLMGREHYQLALSEDDVDPRSVTNGMLLFQKLNKKFMHNIDLTNA